MTEKSNDALRQVFRNCLIFLFYFLATGLVMYCFVSRNQAAGLFDDQRPWGSFGSEISGTAPRPFVYRALVPITVRALSAITPDSVRTKITNSIAPKLSTVGLASITRDTTRPYELILSFPIIWCLFLVLAYAFRYGIMVFYNYSRFVADLAPVFGILSVPVFFLTDHFQIYDPFTLVLFAAAPALIGTGRHKAFYVLYALGAANRETSILITVIFVVWGLRELTKRELLLHIIAQLAIWGTIKALIMYAFRNNPGSTVYLTTYRWLIDLSAFSVSLVYLFSILLIGGFLILYGWSRKPRFLRTAFLAVLVLLMPALAAFAWVFELRTYYELLPLAFLLSVPTAADIFGIDRST